MDSSRATSLGAVRPFEITLHGTAGTVRDLLLVFKPTDGEDNDFPANVVHNMKGQRLVRALVQETVLIAGNSFKFEHPSAE